MKMKSLIMLAAAALMTVSCGSGKAKKATAQDVAEQSRVEATTTLDVDALLADAENLAGKQVNFEGICTHICKHGGRKIFLMGSDDSKTIRVEAGKLGAFDQKCVNSVVKVIGTLCEERIDEAYLQRWEAQVAAQTAEQHGNGEAGCDTEKKARGEVGNTVAERIANFRAKIAARNAAEGKAYLSFYFVEAQAYEVLE
ncbi:MAG: hypothetical protein IJX65_00230 [Alistipes sp.]|nr:hypothetical protein [Alistipes sp.]